jgi:HTH-type transcriptional regulator/antitoxin HigA
MDQKLTIEYGDDARLLAQRLPTVIRTEEENEEMLAAMWELMRKGEDKLSAEELALLELMSVLVERFEEEHYPIPDSPPHRILQHLMESRDAKQADLVPILGGRGRVSELVNGKRAISKAQAKALARLLSRLSGVVPVIASVGRHQDDLLTPEHRELVQSE